MLLNIIFYLAEDMVVGYGVAEYYFYWRTSCYSRLSLTFVVNCVGSSNRTFHNNKHYFIELNIEIKFVIYVCRYICFVYCIDIRCISLSYVVLMCMHDLEWECVCC